MVSKIKIQSTIIPIKAPPGFCNPKNNTDQNIFNTSWIENKTIPDFTFLIFKPLFQTKNKATPIKKNNSVQTGAKIKDGGTQLGFIIFAYQIGILGVVNIDPISPATSAMIIEIKNLKVLLNFIFSSYKNTAMAITVKLINEITHQVQKALNTKAWTNKK